MSKEKQIEEMACENCLHYKACLVNSEYVPSPCRAYENKAGYRKQSEWISVEERLPNRNGRFLIYAKRTHLEGVLLVNYTPKYTFGEESLMGRAVWFSYDSDWGDYEIEGVTHWMPLPKAPKKGGGEE